MFFSLDSAETITTYLIINELYNIVFLRESRYEFLLVFVYSPLEVICYSCI